MTLYQLYTQNGNAAGFWVQHRAWRNVCAKVESIAGQTFGRLPGVAPDHDKAEVAIQLYDVRSGREMREGDSVEPPDDRHFTRIAEPHWSRPPHDRFIVRQ